MPHFVYILYSESYDKYYVGQTDNVSLRLERHNEFENTHTFTSKYRPWVLMAFVEASSRSEAMKIEKALKKLKSKQRIAHFASHQQDFEDFASAL
jgi:putative endonuclease